MHIIFIHIFPRISQFYRIIPQKWYWQYNYFLISAWPFLSPAHVHVICSVWRLLLVLHCNFVILFKVIAQHPLKSKWDKRLQVFTICTTVSIVISERFRLTDRRQCSGGLSMAPRGLAGWFRTSLNTGSSRQGTAISESFRRSEAPLSSAHSTPFRDLQHNAGFICRSSNEKLLGKKNTEWKAVYSTFDLKGKEHQHEV